MSTTADQVRQALGIRLRDIRRDAGLSTTHLAGANGWAPSKVSKIEHGKQTPSEADLRAWCDCCNASDQLADLIAAARSIETQFAEWRRILRSGTKRRQQASASVYENAHVFRIYEPAVVPGLLQTRDYAICVLAITVDFLQIPDDAEQGAEARLDNQRVLRHRDRRFHFVLSEQALHTNVGGNEVMAGQLSHLLTAAQFSHVRLGIIPLNSPYRVPLHNGFWILDNKLVQFDTYSAELSLVRPDEISIYTRAFERLAALAAYGSEARNMISSAAARLERT